MADITDLTLDIEVVNDAAGNLVGNVTAGYRINFSTYDQQSEQPYREICKLIGDDTGITPPEDGVDDAIVNGQLFPQLLFPVPPVPAPSLILLPGTVSSNGQAFLDRVHTKTISLNNLDEDPEPVPNPDELRAVVILTPVMPVAITRESAQFRLNIGV